MANDQFQMFSSAVINALPHDPSTYEYWLRKKPADLELTLQKALVPLCRNPSDAVAARYHFRVVDGDDVEPSKFVVPELDYFIVHPRGSSYLPGETLRILAKAHHANYGLVDGFRIIENSDCIPRWMLRKEINLPGTLLRGHAGWTYLAFLYHSRKNRRWQLGFRRQEDDFDANGRLARVRSAVLV